MINLFSEDIEFLKELYSKKTLELYYFHETYKLSPAQLGRTLKKFNDLGLTILKDKNVALTEKGYKWILINRKQIFLQEKSKYWKEVPLNMKRETLNINELYIPDRKKLDKELFKNIEDGK